MTNAANIRVPQQSVSIIYKIALASFLICCAWLAQAATFPVDAKVATVLLTLLAAAVAGIGAALVYVARCWLEPV